jgi:hypothetical protein
MSTIKIDGRRYDTSKLDEKIKTYDFDESTSVNDLLELINDQSNEIIRLENICFERGDEITRLENYKNLLVKTMVPRRTKGNN